MPIYLVDTRSAFCLSLEKTISKAVILDKKGSQFSGTPGIMRFKSKDRCSLSAFVLLL
jgi:hypothetical protein